MKEKCAATSRIDAQDTDVLIDLGDDDDDDNEDDDDDAKEDSNQNTTNGSRKESNIDANLALASYEFVDSMKRSAKRYQKQVDRLGTVGLFGPSGALDPRYIALYERTQAEYEKNQLSSPVVANDPPVVENNKVDQDDEDGDDR